MLGLLIVTSLYLLVTQEPAEAKWFGKKTKAKPKPVKEFIKPAGIVVDECKTWVTYIDPHRPKLPSDDIVVNAEFSRHFLFKKCKHPNWIDEDDNIRQMTEREYKRALLPVERQTPFKDDDGETWHFWSLERCTEE
jgi:hypothetical protein